MELLPTGDRRVALVEHDQGTDGGGDVADERLGLPGVEAAVAESGVEVMLAERRSTGDLSPVLDHRQGVGSDKLPQTRQASGRGFDGLVESVPQGCQSAVLDGG